MSQNKADKAQTMLFMQALQETQQKPVIASKDGKRYLRVKGSK